MDVNAESSKQENAADHAVDAGSPRRLAVPASLQRAWTSPGARIAAFALILLSYFLAAACLIERLDHTSFLFWAEAIASIAALSTMARLEGRTLASFGLCRPEVLVRDLTAGFAIGGITMAAVVGLMAACGWYHGHIVPVTYGMARSVASALAVFLAIGVAEEVIYRGYFFQTLERGWGSGAAFATTMATFGLVHLTVPIHGASIALRVIGSLSIAVEAGILFTAAYLLTRRLWMPIGIHWAWNFFEGPVFGTPVTGGRFSSIVDGHVSGPAWATGGDFGPEASVPALVIGTILGLIVLWLALRRRRHQ